MNLSLDVGTTIKGLAYVNNMDKEEKQELKELAQREIELWSEFLKKLDETD